MENNSLAKLANSLAPTSKRVSGSDMFLRADEVVMLLLDTSGSMGGSPIQDLSKVVVGIQAQGSVPMIAFGGPYDAQVRFVDIVPEPDGGTPLHLAIPFAKTYGATRLVVVSDGMPDLKSESLNAAREFGGQIDVVFVGHPGNEGSFFLDELAKLTGGRRINADLSNVKAITGTVIGLLEGHVEEERAPITGPGFSAVEAEPVEDEVGTDDEDDFDEDDDEDEEDNDE